MRFMPVAAALIAIAVQSAHAQDVHLSAKQAEQLACISDWMVEAEMDVLLADVYARGDTEGEDYEKTAEEMDVAMLECKKQHGWTDAQTNLAAEVGMFQIVLDANTYRLANSTGVTDAAFGQLGAVLTALPEGDQQILMDGAWRDDEAVLKRLTDRLIAAGIPKNSTILAYAILLMEAKLIVTYGQLDWVKMTPG